MTATGLFQVRGGVCVWGGKHGDEEINPSNLTNSTNIVANKFF